MKNRDGYTLWRLVRNTIFATTAFMRPLKGYRSFQAPPIHSTWNLSMGLKHAPPATRRGCSRSMEGGFEISEKSKMLEAAEIEEESENSKMPVPELPKPCFEQKAENQLIEPDEVFEPRKPTRSSIIKNVAKVENDENSSADENLPEMEVPPRSHGLPVNNLECTPVKDRSKMHLNELSASNPQIQSMPTTPLGKLSATPPLIPAYPKGVAQRSTWSLPKSMSDFSMSKLGLSDKIKSSPSFRNVLSPSMKNSFKSMTETTMNSVNSLTEQVKQSPSIRNRFKFTFRRYSNVPLVGRILRILKVLSYET